MPMYRILPLAVPRVWLGRPRAGRAGRADQKKPESVAQFGLAGLKTTTNRDPERASSCAAAGPHLQRRLVHGNGRSG